MTCQFCNSPPKPDPKEGFTCGSWVFDHKGFRSSECQLGEKILKLTKERDELKAINDRANLDWADDDTKLREMCLKVGIPKSLIDGDTYYVPHIVGLGELLVQKIEGLRAKVARFEEIPENATKADLVQNCRVLSAERDAYKKWIEGLSFWEWNPNQFEHQTVVPLEPGEYAYVGNRKPEGLK